MIHEVTMYRVVCDADGCDRSPQDGGEFFAHTPVEGALIEAEGFDWWLNEDRTRHLCPDHTPTWCDDCGEQHEDTCGGAA